MPINVTAALISALMTVGTKGGCSLGLDQGLEALAHQFGDQLTGSAAAKQLRQLSSGRIGDGLFWFCVRMQRTTSAVMERLWTSCGAAYTIFYAAIHGL